MQEGHPDQGSLLEQTPLEHQGGATKPRKRKRWDDEDEVGQPLTKKGFAPAGGSAYQEEDPYGGGHLHQYAGIPAEYQQQYASLANWEPPHASPANWEAPRPPQMMAGMRRPDAMGSSSGSGAHPQAHQRGVFFSGGREMFSGYTTKARETLAKLQQGFQKKSTTTSIQKQMEEDLDALESDRRKGTEKAPEDGVEDGPRKLILDRFGREVDEKGIVIPIKTLKTSTLKINQRREERKALGVQGYLGKKPAAASSSVQNIQSSSTAVPNTSSGTAATKNGVTLAHAKTFFDPGLLMQGAGRRDRRKGGPSKWNFVQGEKYVEKEKEMLKKVQSKAAERTLQQKIEAERLLTSQASAKGGADPSGIDLIKVASEAQREPEAATPELEWWDFPLVKRGEGGQILRDSEGVPLLFEDAITDLVEHPVPIEVGEKKDKGLSSLTPKERKKLRRMRRQERAEALRKQIRLGIIEPPPPKTKLKTLMRGSLGDRQIADPTAVEQEALNEQEQRRKDHEARNLTHKKTPEEARQKKIKKWQGGTLTKALAASALGNIGDTNIIEEPAQMTHVMIVQLRELNNKQRFLVTRNAIQYQMTGVLIICPKVANLLVVEGAKTPINRYRRLLQRRIKWEQAVEEEDEEPRLGEAPAPPCQILWEGTQKAHSFGEFKTHTVKSEAEARQIFINNKVESWWTVLEQYRDPRKDV